MVPAIPRCPKPHARFRSAGARAARLAGCLAAAAVLAASASALAAAPQEETLGGPDIVIIAEPERTIYEFRQAGELRMVRIEPRFGKPYYLVPRDSSRGFGNLERADMLLPSWVILEF